MKNVKVYVVGEQPPDLVTGVVLALRPFDEDGQVEVVKVATEDEIPEVSAADAGNIMVVTIK
jgi:hypothetical protein